MSHQSTLTVTDNRTGDTAELPIENGTVSAMEFRQFKTSDDDFGLKVYDPGFKNTASTKSAITWIDGEAGILRHRGYPIEQLAKQSTYLESAWLLLHGELPDADELQTWEGRIDELTLLPESVADTISTFRIGGDPMGMFVSAVAALSPCHPEAGEVEDGENRALQIRRILASVPTIAAFCFRRRGDLPLVYPERGSGFVANFLEMLFAGTEREAVAREASVRRAVEMLLILHIDHEQNCSANAMRAIGSSGADPYLSLAGAAAALSGPLHGGANQRVLRMLEAIGSPDAVPDFLEKAKDGKRRVMGFGHRVYKNRDPRAEIIKTMVEEVFDAVGRNELIEVARRLEEEALDDDYFTSRKLYPNVDFYSGILYQAIGFPAAMFPVLFAVARTAGWLAQWQEMVEDDEQKIARPRQIYLGPDKRDYVPVKER